MRRKVGKHLLCVFVAATVMPLAFANGQDSLRIIEVGDIDAYQETADDDAETKLLKERVRAVLDAIDAKMQRVMNGEENVIFLLETQRRLVTALLDFHTEPEEIISILEKNVTLAKEIEANRKGRSEAGLSRPDDLAMAQYYRATAELQLLRARKKYGVNNDD
ncbi:MAG: hypothetical protein ACR2NP_15310 [Pirellulaceae bacterium]